MGVSQSHNHNRQPNELQSTNGALNRNNISSSGRRFSNRFFKKRQRQPVNPPPPPPPTTMATSKPQITYPYPRTHCTVVLPSGLNRTPQITQIPVPPRPTRPPLNRACPPIPESRSNESIKSEMSQSTSKQSFDQVPATIPEDAPTSSTKGVSSSLVIENKLAVRGGIPSCSTSAPSKPVEEPSSIGFTPRARRRDPVPSSPIAVYANKFRTQLGKLGGRLSRSQDSNSIKSSESSQGSTMSLTATPLPGLRKFRPRSGSEDSPVRTDLNANVQPSISVPSKLFKTPSFEWAKLKPSKKTDNAKPKIKKDINENPIPPKKPEITKPKPQISKPKPVAPPASKPPRSIPKIPVLGRKTLLPQSRTKQTKPEVAPKPSKPAMVRPNVLMTKKSRSPKLNRNRILYPTGDAPLAESESSTVENSPAVEFPPGGFQQNKSLNMKIPTPPTARRRSSNNPSPLVQNSGPETKTSENNNTGNQMTKIPENRIKSIPQPTGNHSQTRIKARQPNVCPSSTDIPEKSSLQQKTITKEDTDQNSLDRTITVDSGLGTTPPAIGVLSNSRSQSFKEQANLLTKDDSSVKISTETSMSSSMTTESAGSKIDSPLALTCLDQGDSYEAGDTVGAFGPRTSRTRDSMRDSILSTTSSLDGDDCMIDYESSVDYGDDAFSADGGGSWGRKRSLRAIRESFRNGRSTGGGPIRTYSSTSAKRDSIDLDGALEQLNSVMSKLSMDEENLNAAHHRSPGDGEPTKRDSTNADGVWPVSASTSTVLKPPLSLSVDSAGLDNIDIDPHLYTTMCQDVVGLKTLLLQLKGVLQKADTANPFESALLLNSPGTPTSLHEQGPFCVRLQNGQVKTAFVGSPKENPLVTRLHDLEDENTELRSQLLKLRSQLADEHALVKKLQSKKSATNSTPVVQSNKTPVHNKIVSPVVNNNSIRTDV